MDLFNPGTLDPSEYVSFYRLGLKDLKEIRLDELERYMTRETGLHKHCPHYHFNPRRPFQNLGDKKFISTKDNGGFELKLWLIRLQTETPKHSYLKEAPKLHNRRKSVFDIFKKQKVEKPKEPDPNPEEEDSMTGFLEKSIDKDKV